MLLFTSVAFKVCKSYKKSWASFMWLLRVSAKYINCSPSAFLSIYIFWNTIQPCKVTSLRSFSDEKYGQIWELRKYGSTFRSVLHQETVNLNNEYRRSFHICFKESNGTWFQLDLNTFCLLTNYTSIYW